MQASQGLGPIEESLDQFRVGQKGMIDHLQSFQEVQRSMLGLAAHQEHRREVAFELRISGGPPNRLFEREDGLGAVSLREPQQAHIAQGLRRGIDGGLALDLGSASADHARSYRLTVEADLGYGFKGTGEADAERAGSRQGSPKLLERREYRCRRSWPAGQGEEHRCP
jgi:hypothetical protein